MLQHTRKNIWLLATLLFMLGSHVMYAQEPVSMKVVPTINYLPSTVYYVTTDANQFIWIGSNTGVYKYDGYNFTHYTSADGLGDNEILRIYEDKKGRIWFQSVNGNPSFYLDGKIYNASNSDLVKQLKFKKMILTECEDDNGNLYIGSRQQIYYKIDPNDVVTKFEYEGQENFAWIGADKQIKYLNYRFQNTFQAIRGNALDDLIYICQQLTIYKIEKDSILNVQYKLPDEAQEIIFVRIKSPNEIYLGTRNGLYVYYPNTNKPLRHLMSGLSISSVVFDFEDNLWVSTLEAGVYLIPSLEVNIINSKNGLPEDKITCIEHDAKGNLWVGMAKNNYSIINQQGEIKNNVLSASSSHDVTNIRHFGETTYIIGKSNIAKVNGNAVKSYGIYGNDIFFTETDSVYIAQDNTIVVDLDMFENHIHEVVYNMATQRKLYEFLNARTNVLKGDKYDNLWIGTSKGVFYSKTGIVELGKVNPIFNSPVRDIAFDNNGFFTYIATLNGLLILKDNKLAKLLDKSNGMPNSECNAIFVDTQNYIWAAFGNELLRIKYSDTHLEVINYSDKLKLEAGRITDIDNIDNTVYIATESGLIYFDKTSTSLFQTAPRLWFKDFAVNSISYINNTNTTFSHNQNDITISYSGMSFISKAEITYKYLLEGYDTEWHLTDERSLHFKSLPPGNYIFKIAAINKSGLASSIGEIPFTIKPPFWTQWWFWILVLSVVSLSLYMLWRKRLQTLRAQYEQKNKTVLLEKENAEIEKKLLDLHQQAFRQQMNPHFIFNALNTIKGYYAENDVKKASDYISKFSRLLRNILENKEQLIPLEKEIQAVKLYLELAGMRYENKFVFSILTGDNVNITETGIPPMLLQPFIENSLIHGIAPKQGKGTILIEFTISNGRLLCAITDDGVGRRASSTKSRLEPHNSKATLLITEYLTALNNKENSDKFTLDISDLFANDGTAIGTRVTLSMPLMFIVNPII